MKLKNFILTVFATLGASAFSDAYAQRFSQYVEPQSLYNSRFTVEEGQYKQFALGAWRYVERLFIQAEGGSQDGRLDVIINGKAVGTIHAPGRDPSYIVNVKESIKSIEFRHISGGRVYVRNIVAEQSAPLMGLENLRPLGTPLGQGARTQAAALSARAIALVDVLKGYSNMKEEHDFLMPIKKVAARAYAKAQARSDLSEQTRDMVIALAAQILYADQYIDETFERSEAFKYAVELLALRETIQALLQ